MKFPSRLAEPRECRFSLRLALLLVLSAGLGSTADAVQAGEVRFEEVGAQHGIGPFTMANGKGGSVAAADIDDDGDVDLFVPTAAGFVDQLYLNDGSGNFEDIAVQAGVASTRRNRAALWFDYDGDGRLDLFVAGDCWQSAASCPFESTLLLYRQIDDVRFEDVTDQAGFGDDLVLTTTPHRAGAAAGDINNDGWLDLVVGLWNGRARLFRNNGDGTFTDIGPSSGLGQFVEAHWQPMLFDVDGDGWQDIYYAIDFTANRLWINQRDETFVDVAPQAGLDNRWNDMGMALGDYDNDGDLDIHVTNITTGDRHNALFRNDTQAGTPAFVEVAEESGVWWGGWGWGTTFLDADNDGRLDLAATNGWFSGAAATDESRFYHNDGGTPVTFGNQTAESGFDDRLWGSSLVAVDYDRDGDQDLIQTANGSGVQPGAVRLLRNDRSGAAAGHRWLVVRPRQSGPNRRAIGATVRVRAAGQEWTRPITAGTSFLGQEPAEAFFGLGVATQVETVVVEWPDGAVTTRGPFAVDQVVTITPIGFTDVTDAPLAQTDVLNESLAWGDYDNDGDQDLYLTNNGPNRLLRNDGPGGFADVTSAAGVGDPGFSVGTAFGDLDNDGDLDLYVVSFGAGSDVLYRNDGPDTPGGAYRFSDVTLAAGTTDLTSSRGMALLDYDRDGLLDIYVNAIGPDILYRNLGELRFTNVAAALGVATPGQGVGVVASDVDGNGWIDLYTGNRSSELNRLYLNDRGVFSDVTLAAGIVEVGLGMGVLSLDYDNDLDFDLYWTSWPPEPNALYRNLDGSHFENVAIDSGTLDPAGWGISCNAGDIDNDGWQDFFVTNGFSDSTTPNVLYRNLGTGAFEDVTSLVGGGDFDGRGVAFADVDRDGDVDLAVTADAGEPSRLWRNDTANGHGWVVLELTGTCSNRSAIGARVEVRANGRTFVKEVSGGAGRGSQNSLPLEFGLGAATTIDRVDVRWPNGLDQTFDGLGPNRYHALVESAACGTPLLTVDPVVLSWTANGGADMRFDVVAGQIGLLRTTAGDFAAATTGCLLQAGDDPSVAHGSRPRSGRGFWFLVRSREGDVVGSWDTGLPAQRASRDAGIAASVGACP